jgi:hypothetical protein
MSSNTIRLGKVTLHYNHRKASTSKTSVTQPSVLVKIPRDPLAVDIQLHQPQRSKLSHSSVWNANERLLQLNLERRLAYA